MKSLNVDARRLLKRLRRYMRTIQDLEDRLETLAEGVGDDLLFLGAELKQVQNHPVPGPKAVKSSPTRSI